jgi:LmbE family N-acetylglucosaminyl deacetylase
MVQAVRRSSDLDLAASRKLGCLEGDDLTDGRHPRCAGSSGIEPGGIGVKARDLVGVPNILAMRRVLAFGAHPDDTEVWSGATLAKLIGLGARVDWVVATDGGHGTLDARVDRAALRATRRGEQATAVGILGGGQISWLGFEDRELREHRSAVATAVLTAIRAAAPEVVLCPDPWLPYESHPDHRTIGMVVTEAVGAVNFPSVDPAAGPPVDPPAVAYYGTAWPNTRVDVTNLFDTKLRALFAHESQFPPAVRDPLGVFLRVRAQEYGAEAGVELAEAFKVLTAMQLHFYPDAWLS